MATNGMKQTSADVRAARELLDVTEQANQEEILAAWKKTMRLAHPDRAASGERSSAEMLSARLNQAKDILLTDLEGGTRPENEWDASSSWSPDYSPSAGTGISRKTRIFLGSSLILLLVALVFVALLDDDDDSSASSSVSTDEASTGSDTDASGNIPPISTTTMPTTSTTIRLQAVVVSADSLGSAAETDAPDPDSVILSLLESVGDVEQEKFEGLLHPDGRVEEIREVASSLSADNVSLSDREVLSRETHCVIFEPGRAHCHFNQRSGLADVISHEIDLGKTPTGWRVLGWWKS